MDLRMTLLGGFLLWPVLVLADEFTLPPGCEVPWKEIAVDHLITMECGREGKSEGGPGANQNRMKNNLCATNEPVSLSYGDFSAMQRKANRRREKEADFNFGTRQHPIRNRAKLRDFYTTKDGTTVGEGVVVRHSGFLAEARKARIGTSGESVNCKLTEKDENDIHIDIVRRPSDSPCLSVTAEMIPHFRPDSWTPENLNHIRDLRLPVRVTGHLFFDSSHTPCVGTKSPGPGHPLRVSVWEIHPVYKFEVCRNRTKASCPEGDTAVWLDLHEWVQENRP